MNSKLHTSSLLRVGLLIGANRIGGAERQVLLLAKGLSHAGIPVTVFFMDTPPLFRNEIKYDFGEVECKYLWNNCYTKLLSVKYFANCLKRRKISILHMFLPDTMKYGMIGAHMAGIKHTVGSVRGILFSEDKVVQKRLVKACQDIGFITCNCKAIRDLMVSLKISPQEKIKVVNNGIEMAKDPREKKHYTRKNGFNVIFVGSLKDVKNPLGFVRSALTVLDTVPDCNFIIAGDGPLKSLMEDLINKSQWSRQFCLLGCVHQEEIPYHQSHLLVSTSKREGSSNAVLEALACGIPAVGTAVGGTKELLEGQSFGCLVETEDERGIADAIIEFYNKDETEMKKLSLYAQSFIRKNFSVTQLVERHIALYGGILF